MKLAQLLARYESGAIADHEFAVESLNLLDPRDPSTVLQALPAEILPHLWRFLQGYRPGQMRSSQGGPIPTPEQVEAAKEWLDGCSIAQPRLTIA